MILVLFFVVNINAIDYRDGYIAKDYKGSNLGKVVVYYPDIALSMERFFEEGFVELLNTHDHINATTLLDVISPIDQLSDAETIAKLSSLGYEQLFLITSSKYKRDNIITQGPVFNNLYSLADVVMKVEIFDLQKNKKLMWLGDVSISRDVNTHELRNYIRKQIVYLLEKDGLIKD